MIKEVYIPYFKDKKVTVLGLGLLGRGTGDTEFLIKNCGEVICTDTRSEEKLKESIAYIKKDNPKNLKLVIGENRLEDFENRDFILACNGLPADYEYLMHARENNIPVYMSASMVCDIIMKEIPDTVIIGVTGTRGKSTVTELIAHILRENGMGVRLGGNIRGVANLPLLEKIEEGDFLVMELDSWQLQNFGELKISPNIAIFTSFLDDHMNYYKNDKKLYFADKANIYRNQIEGDVLIASPQASSEIIMQGERVAILIPEKNVFETNLIGEHNQMACALAYEACLQCGLDEESIKDAIKTFKGIEGRLQDMGEVKAKIAKGSNGDSPDSQSEFRGVKVFNDNNGTTEDATVMAINSIVEKFGRKPILIVGGADKFLPINKLEESIKENTKEVIYLSGTGTDRISLPKKYEFEKLEDCVNKAFELAEEGDIILFSPAFASFSKYFNNEYERNDEFVRCVSKH